MGRSRRRQWHVDTLGSDSQAEAEAEAVDTLAPTNVPRAAQSEWSNDVVAPVLPLEGLQPWEQIAGPALALEEPGEVDAAVIESDDPAQLVLEPVPAADFGLEIVTAPVEDEAAPQSEPEPEPIAEPEPDPAEVAYAQARAAAEAGDVPLAKTLYRQLLTTYPGHIGARNNLALLLDAGGDHAGALAELDRALDIDAENATLLVNRGGLLGAMGRFAAAERDLKRVLRVEPAQAEALFNLGIVMTKKGLWTEAVPHLRRAIELEPGRGAAHFYLGEALNHVDDLHGAMAAYQRAAELQPHNPRALYGLGIVYDRLGRPDDAAQMYRRSREVGRR
ncbi:MAG: tetratricopeptide repeat protein [Gemmatimonadales bacterium]|nr:tetratricopeptide repeat protein [Gemmatimonadales bacterium]